MALFGMLFLTDTSAQLPEGNPAISPRFYRHLQSVINLTTHIFKQIKTSTGANLLLNCSYLIRATLSNGLSFTAYTYAGELPSCAFGFNSNGLAFTLDSVSPSMEEIIPGGIDRNLISHDLLNATGLDDAISRIHSSNVSVGHSYNLIDVHKCKIINVETASGKRVSIVEVGSKPFFHANMYLHLKVKQSKGLLVSLVMFVLEFATIVMH
ncbi:uncharacterized protein [Aristolochia californica]|uniref:uncharacterized protein n=1 Tax=Aristolochia californica TaxID=171875 RepID=UPI0035DA9D46